jgi:hypothetical protein
MLVKQQRHDTDLLEPQLEEGLAVGGRSSLLMLPTMVDVLPTGCALPSLPRPGAHAAPLMQRCNLTRRTNMLMCKHGGIAMSSLRQA